MVSAVRSESLALRSPSSNGLKAVLTSSCDSYVSRSPPKSPSPAPPDAKTFPTATTPLGTPSRTLVAPARPPSPTKLAQSFLQQDDGELSSVFGSVLSPKDNWQCAACTSKFRQVSKANPASFGPSLSAPCSQEEVIYPHPDAKGDASLAEVFFCRQCFAERFRKGNWSVCSHPLVERRTDPPAFAARNASTPSSQMHRSSSMTATCGTR